MKISVIVPCYNALSKIEKCIKSLESINFPQNDFEVIFVDDFSSDNTVKYIKDNLKNKNNWRLVELSKNSGSPSRPRNEGINIAKGDYLFFIDCDDEILYDTLKSYYDFAIKKDADILRGYLLVDNGEKRLSMNRIDTEFNSITKKEKIENIISKQSTTVCSLIKKEIVLKNKIFWKENLRMGEDTVFLIECLLASEKIYYIDHPTFIYHKKQSQVASSTQQYGSKELRNHLEVWEYARKRLLEVNIDYYKIRLQVGLQTAIQGMIKFDSSNIGKEDFERLSLFVRNNEDIILNFNYNKRIKEIISILINEKYEDFLLAIKQRLVISGYDLKFIKPIISYLEVFYEVRVDEWAGHNINNETHSLECLNWGEIILCEWMLGNAVWYSNRVTNEQKLFIRMHRFELTTKWYKEIDFRRVNRVFAVSVYFFEKLVEITGISRSLASLLPNYLDIDNYQKSDEQSKLYHLGMIGILPSRKGYMESLKILKKLVAKDLRYKLFIFGKAAEDLDWIKNNHNEMNYYISCDKFIKDNNLQNHIVFEGWVDVKKGIKDIGFIISSSNNEEFPESFHLAPADAFCAGNQGLLLNWNGVEYIYPKKYIFNSIEHIAHHIYSQRNMKDFDAYRSIGENIINRKYSIERFVLKFNDVVALSNRRINNSPYPTLVKERFLKSVLSFEDYNISKNKNEILIPKEFSGSGNFFLEYEPNISANTKINAALISLKVEGSNQDIENFQLSEFDDIGIYKYLDTSQSNILRSINFSIPEGSELISISFILWHEDANINLKELKLLRY
ncbi:glycosyltransferase [Psychrobacter sp. AOP30-A2-5]|uniref:glycosyltransferase n=1 Tax=Psychrobacter sp. AOP30-A2-5 TaxID=3457697 RepID=UPI004035DAE2